MLKSNTRSSMRVLRLAMVASVASPVPLSVSVSGWQQIGQWRGRWHRRSIRRQRRRRRESDGLGGGDLALAQGTWLKSVFTSRQYRCGHQQNGRSSGCPLFRSSLLVFGQMVCQLQETFLVLFGAGRVGWAAAATATDVCRSWCVPAWIQSHLKSAKVEAAALHPRPGHHCLTQRVGQRSVRQCACVR